MIKLNQNIGPTRVDTRPLISVKNLDTTRLIGSDIKLITIKDKSYLV